MIEQEPIQSPDTGAPVDEGADSAYIPSMSDLGGIDGISRTLDDGSKFIPSMTELRARGIIDTEPEVPPSE